MEDHQFGDIFPHETAISHIRRLRAVGADAEEQAAADLHSRLREPRERDEELLLLGEPRLEEREEGGESTEADADEDGEAGRLCGGSVGRRRTG